MHWLLGGSFQVEPGEIFYPALRGRVVWLVKSISPIRRYSMRLGKLVDLWPEAWFMPASIPSRLMCLQLWQGVMGRLPVLTRGRVVLLVFRCPVNVSSCLMRLSSQELVVLWIISCGGRVCDVQRLQECLQLLLQHLWRCICRRHI